MAGEKKYHGFQTARHADFAEDMLQVRFDGVIGQTQLIGHFLV